MIKKTLLFCVFLLGLHFIAEAQVEFPKLILTNQKRSYVFKDPRIDLLVKKQRYTNTLALKNISGYRVQVLSTRNRSAANKARAKLMELFPKYETYLDYQSPYFRVRIGNFIQRDSAIVLQKKLDTYFPNGVFSVRSQIKINPEVLLRQLNAEHNDTGD